MAPEAPPEASGSEASMQESRRAANRRKVREHRQRLRAQGMRPIQIWVLDVQSPEEAEIQAFIDSVYEWPDDEYTQ